MVRKLIALLLLVGGCSAPENTAGEGLTPGELAKKRAEIVTDPEAGPKSSATDPPGMPSGPNAAAPR